jgi:hypothetical protein
MMHDDGDTDVIVDDDNDNDDDGRQRVDCCIGNKAIALAEQGRRDWGGAAS